jgi:hypothetical protein
VKVEDDGRSRVRRVRVGDVDVEDATGTSYLDRPCSVEWLSRIFGALQRRIRGVGLMCEAQCRRACRGFILDRLASRRAPEHGAKAERTHDCQDDAVFTAEATEKSAHDGSLMFGRFEAHNPDGYVISLGRHDALILDELASVHGSEERPAAHLGRPLRRERTALNNQRKPQR